MVKLSRYSKYATLLKNSIAYMETPDWRIFHMKYLAAAVEVAMRRGAEIYLGDYEWLNSR